MSRRQLILPLALIAVARPVHGQAGGRVDAVAGGIPAPTRGGMSSVWGLAPAFWAQGPRWRISAEGELRGGDPAAAAATAALTASIFSSLGSGGPLLGEITTDVRARTGASFMNGVAGELGGRVHLADGRRGLWLGLTGGRDLRGPTARWELAAWHRFGNVALQLSGSQTSAVDLVQRVATRPDTLSVSSDTSLGSRVRVSTDLGAWFRWSPPRFDLAVGAGRRYGATEVALSPAAPGRTSDQASSGGATSTVAGWWMADGTFWVSPRVGLNLAVGRNPRDRTFGTPAGAFFRFALRGSFGRGGNGVAPPARQASGLRHHRTRDGAVELTLYLSSPGSLRTVELMGDFTDWRPVPMVPEGDGRWTIRLPIAAGLHHLNVRYDGGPWQPPPGTSVVADEFDRVTGMLVTE
jgi:hypothetical protein